MVAIHSHVIWPHIGDISSQNKTFISENDKKKYQPLYQNKRMWLKTPFETTHVPHHTQLILKNPIIFSNPTKSMIATMNMVHTFNKLTYHCPYLVMRIFIRNSRSLSISHHYLPGCLSHYHISLLIRDRATTRKQQHRRRQWWRQLRWYSSISARLGEVAKPYLAHFKLILGINNSVYMVVGFWEGGEFCTGEGCGRRSRGGLESSEKILIGEGKKKKRLKCEWWKWLRE